MELLKISKVSDIYEVAGMAAGETSASAKDQFSFCINEISRTYNLTFSPQDLMILSLAFLSGVMFAKNLGQVTGAKK